MMANELKIQSVKILRDTRLRYERATSDADREEALREYDAALARFRQLVGLLPPAEEAAAKGGGFLIA
jgi:hypothetical protein